MIIYHGTPATKFKEFRSDRATYFFILKEEALALVKAHGGRVLAVELEELPGEVAGPNVALEVWNSVNEAQPSYIYSMLCRQTHEFTYVEIDRFTAALKSRGFAAVRHWDYSQQNMANDAEAVCVLDASGLKFSAV